MQVVVKYMSKRLSTRSRHGETTSAHTFFALQNPTQPTVKRVTLTSASSSTFKEAKSKVLRAARTATTVCQVPSLTRRGLCTMSGDCVGEGLTANARRPADKVRAAKSVLFLAALGDTRTKVPTESVVRNVSEKRVSVCPTSNCARRKDSPLAKHTPPSMLLVVFLKKLLVLVVVVVVPVALAGGVEDGAVAPVVATVAATVLVVPSVHGGAIMLKLTSISDGQAAPPNCGWRVMLRVRTGRR